MAIYDPDVVGKWREQVAACSSSNCELFDVRPMPVRSGANSNAMRPSSVVNRTGEGRMAALGSSPGPGRNLGGLRTIYPGSNYRVIGPA